MLVLRALCVLIELCVSKGSYPKGIGGDRVWCILADHLVLFMVRAHGGEAPLTHRQHAWPRSLIPLKLGVATGVSWCLYVCHLAGRGTMAKCGVYSGSLRFWWNTGHENQVLPIQTSIGILCFVCVHTHMLVSECTCVCLRLGIYLPDAVIFKTNRLVDTAWISLPLNNFRINSVYSTYGKWPMQTIEILSFEDLLNVVAFWCDQCVVSLVGICHLPGFISVMGR
jgi:hypothetical protein